MPAFNQQQLNRRVRNANSVTVLIGDQVVGFAQTTAHGTDFGTEGMYGIGSAKPQELQQLRVSPQISLDAFALTAAGLTALGQPSNIANVLANNQFNLHIVDGVTNLPIFTYVGCVASNFNENIPANQPISDSISFLALDILDSNGNSILDLGNAYQIPGQITASVSGLGATV